MLNSVHSYVERNNDKNVIESWVLNTLRKLKKNTDFNNVEVVTKKWVINVLVWWDQIRDKNWKFRNFDSIENINMNTLPYQPVKWTEVITRRWVNTVLINWVSLRDKQGYVKEFWEVEEIVM